MLPTSASFAPVQSPVKRNSLPPASTRSTTLSSFGSPESDPGLRTLARSAPKRSVMPRRALVMRAPTPRSAEAALPAPSPT